MLGEGEVVSYGGKLIVSLSDRVLDIAADDVAGCLLRAYDAPEIEDAKYRDYFAKMSDLANEIQAEKMRRGASDSGNES